MGERKRLNFTADESQKARWEEHVEQSIEYDSLSEFFRKASEHELSRGHPLEEQQQQLPTKVAVELDDLRNEIEELHSEVAWIRKQMHDETDLNEIAREVNRHLPNSIDQVMKRQHDQMQDEDEFVNTGTVEDLAEIVDEEPRVVEDAITYLQNNFLEVKETTSEAGTTHFYRPD